MKILPKYDSGQALLLVLLSMAVVLTITLSVISRSVTDISITTSSEDSLRAFSAAEAGVEQAIIAGTGDEHTFENNASFVSTVSDFSSGLLEFVYPFGNLSAGDSGVIWFASHDSNGNLICSLPTYPCYGGNKVDICWGKEGTSGSLATTPAIEVSIFYLTDPSNFSTARIYRAAVDPNQARAKPNNFSAPDVGSCTIEGTPFAFKKTINYGPLINNLQFARVRFLYNTESHPFGVKGDADSFFPSQGKKIDSQGSAGEANRRVEVIQGYGELPLPFADAVFSQGGITQ